MRLRGNPACAAVAFGLAATPFAHAGVVNQRAVAQTLLLAFAVFAAVLLLILVAIVAVATRQPHRRKHIRLTLISFPAAAVAALVWLAVVQDSFARLDAALVYCVVFLLATAVVLIAFAFFASRRDVKL
jgi:hypothetical protein